MESNKKIILASGSPRRRELLGKFSVPFQVIPATGEEIASEGLTPEELVLALSEQKAKEVQNRVQDSDAVIIAADTIVEVNGQVLGKPANKEAACQMLRMLSGKEHRVWTGLCVVQGQKICKAAEKTCVHFRAMSDEEISAYVATGEPMDKAGAYGYQGMAGIFVEKINGDYFNVVGLPLCRLNKILREFDITLLP